MSSPSRKLWATTRINAIEVPIYSVANLNGDEGRTSFTPKDGIVVEICAAAFRQAARFDDTLIHEFIHVAEFHYGAALDFKASDGCSPAVRLLGSALAQMIRELKMVDSKCDVAKGSSFTAGKSK